MNKKIQFIALCLAAFSGSMQAQDTYLNDRATNASDIIGSARYVGMGGAMGALGADISVISNNPAGIGMIRKNNVSFTLGGVVQDAAPAYGDDRAHFTFDQIGFVVPFMKDDDIRVNFAFNYQKKINYNQSLFTQQALNGLSQSDMFAWIANNTWNTDNDGNLYFYSPFYDNLYAAGFFGETGAPGNEYFAAPYRGLFGNYTRCSSGSLQGFDFNLSGSVNERVFWGLTFGIDRMRYEHSASYEEIGEDSYVLYQDQELKGHGFNFKAGLIARPFEDNALRFGLAVESPTWTMLKHRGWAGVSVLNGEYYTQPSYMYDDNYLEYNVYTPWKVRVSAASTISDFFAWDVEYEYSMNNLTKMGYPKEGNYTDYYDYYDDYPSGPRVAMTKDSQMNQLTRNVMRGVHNVRAGFEIKPFDQVAVRAGYNFYSKPFKSNARLDQTCDSPAYDFSTSTEYINLGVTHIFTLGLGYQGKHFFADLAYKYRMQKGDFYAFDDNFTSYNASFMADHPALTHMQLQPSEVNLDRHSFAITLGCKF